MAGGLGGAGGAALGRSSALSDLLSPLDWSRQAFTNLAISPFIKDSLGSPTDPLNAVQPPPSGSFGGMVPGLLGLLAGGAAAFVPGLTPFAPLIGAGVGGLAQGIGHAIAPEATAAPSAGQVGHALLGTEEDNPLASALVGALTDPLSLGMGLGVGGAAGRAGAARGARAALAGERMTPEVRALMGEARSSMAAEDAARQAAMSAREQELLPQLQARAQAMQQGRSMGEAPFLDMLHKELSGADVGIPTGQSSVLSHANVTYNPAVIDQLPSLGEMAARMQQSGNAAGRTFNRATPQLIDQLEALGLGQRNPAGGLDMLTSGDKALGLSGNPIMGHIGGGRMGLTAEAADIPDLLTRLGGGGPLGPVGESEMASLLAPGRSAPARAMLGGDRANELADMMSGLFGSPLEAQAGGALPPGWIQQPGGKYRHLLDLTLGQAIDASAGMRQAALRKLLG